ncbi:hypothetical protein EDC01DRAFT_610911 [Geopyxis carbonaria]|nr:hypothetical protein EDC01DRAFT_610911 [Geopyxis carbonaria]
MWPPILLVLALSAPGLDAAKVSIPTHAPASATGPLDPALASFSIELSYFTDFAGNLTHPNVLFARALALLKDRTGVSPSIRPGGITADSTWFSPTAPALVRDQSPSGGIYRTTTGPAWFDSFHTLPDDVMYTLDLNLGNNSLANTTAQAAAVLKYLPRKQLFAFELGNEPDHFGDSFDEANSGVKWDMAAYTKKYLNWTSSITASLGLKGAWFGAGTFADDPPTGAFNTTGILALGASSNGLTNSYSQHMYPFSSCDPPRFSLATLPHLVSHTHITSYLDRWLPHIAAANAAGAEFNVGEHNSVSCSGKLGVTDTFGQALWLADTTLGAAVRGVARMYLHQGATLVFQSNTQANTPGYSKYNVVMPTASDATGPARMTPGWVGYLLVAEALGKSGGARIAEVEVAEEEVAVYAIWERGRLARAVVLNMRGPGVTLDFGRRGTVKRMSSTGVNEKNPRLVTWAGQEYFEGVPRGVYTEERTGAGVNWRKGKEGEGTVWVEDGGGALVSF